MRSRTRIIVRNGECSFLYDNWTGIGTIIDIFQLQGLQDLRSLRLRDLYIGGSWDILALQEFLPSSAITLVVAHHFQFGEERDLII